MPEYTQNYRLIKPKEDEHYNVDDFNRNADVIDSALKAAEASVESRKDTIPKAFPDFPGIDVRWSGAHSLPATVSGIANVLFAVGGGAVWGGTTDRAYKFIMETGQLITVNTSFMQSGNSLGRAFVYKDKCYALTVSAHQTTATIGVQSFDGKIVQTLATSPTVNMGTNKRNIIGLDDARGNIWISSDEGLRPYHIETNTWGTVITHIDNGTHGSFTYNAHVFAYGDAAVYDGTLYYKYAGSINSGAVRTYRRALSQGSGGIDIDANVIGHGMSGPMSVDRLIYSLGKGYLYVFAMRTAVSIAHSYLYHAPSNSSVVLPDTLRKPVYSGDGYIALATNMLQRLV